jgi:hypothetical protein
MTLAADLIELPRLRAENETLRAALALIRDREGRVCGKPCTHESCHSSRASVEIASAALRSVEGKR